MTDRLSEAELADRSGLAVDHLRKLIDLGILQSQDGRFERSDVMRARVVAQLEANGIDAEALAAALASGHLELGYLESAGRRFPGSERTFAEVAGDMGVSFSTLERIYVAFGLPRPDAAEPVREEDLEQMKGIGILFEAGLEEEEVVRMARVWGDSARRVAQYLTHHFHNVVEERFRRRGLGDNQAYEAALWEVGLRIGHSGEDLLGWLFRRHSETFQIEHQFGHVETALELAGVRRRTPRAVETAVFADLSGYTELTEEAGDDAAAEMAVGFAQLAGEVAARHRGDVVKLLGDGVFLRFESPDAAVLAALDLVESTEPRGLPGAHIGVNSGPMLYDQGDYFGRTVNLAARIASEAGPGQVFLGESVADVVSGAGFTVADVGRFDLKGIPKPIHIYRAIRADRSVG